MRKLILLMLITLKAYTHYAININCINCTGFPKYICLLLQVTVNLWESGIGVSGSVCGLFELVSGALLLLVDDGVPLKIGLGGIRAGLKLLILLFLEPL